MTALLTIPCYNEASRLPSLLEQIARSGFAVTVEVVHDGSSECQRAETQRLDTRPQSSLPLPAKIPPHFPYLRFFIP